MSRCLTVLKIITLQTISIFLFHVTFAGPFRNGSRENKFIDKKQTGECLILTVPVEKKEKSKFLNKEEHRGIDLFLLKYFMLIEFEIFNKIEIQKIEANLIQLNEAESLLCDGEKLSEEEQLQKLSLISQLYALNKEANQKRTKKIDIKVLDEKLEFMRAKKERAKKLRAGYFE